MNMENEYLELVKQLKDKYDANEALVERISRNNINLKKHIMVAYSLTRIVDDGDFVDPTDHKVFLEILRGHLSRVVEMEILRCECGNVRVTPELEEVDLEENT